jgi:ubiquinone/menaquinone biosynthesis C-methylase UbiE
LTAERGIWHNAPKSGIWHNAPKKGYFFSLLEYAYMTDGSYLPLLSIDEYLNYIRLSHPLLYGMLDLTRARSTSILAELYSFTNEFDSDVSGRGDSYRQAQQDPLVRWCGARQLLDFAIPSLCPMPAIVLDVLGGDGTIARALAAHDAAQAKLRILTGDVSGQMVAQALAHGLPAVRQAAEALLIRDGALDGVLIAYGSHHIAPAKRPDALQEAVRVLHPGGRIVFHDFDESSPMVRFFTQIVHPYSRAGHDYQHISRTEFASLSHSLPLQVQMVDLYDPLITYASTADAARDRMCSYLSNMYGIAEFFETCESNQAAWSILTGILDHSEYLRSLPIIDNSWLHQPAIYRAGDGYVAELPRMAIVAVAKTLPPGDTTSPAPVHH